MTKVKKQTIVGFICGVIIYTLTATVSAWETSLAFGLGVVVGMTWITYWHSQS